MTVNRRNDADTPRLGTEITRRDFIGTTLIGAGAALLYTPRPGRAQELGAAWTGYGGTGDYRFSNGNTASVVQSAHRIRDHAYDGELHNVIDSRESYDVVIIGGGFSGLAAMYEFAKLKPNGKCLLLDNQPIFGGFAKSNEFDVDGYRITGPQASMDFGLPGPEAGGIINDYWNELGLPGNFQFANEQAGNRDVRFAKSISATLFGAENWATIGYYFENALTHGKGVWIKDIWHDDLNRAPWPDSYKRELLAFVDRKMRYRDDKTESAWLDTMSYADFVTKVMGLNSDVLSYITPITDVIGSPQVSAYAAASLPGVGRYSGRNVMEEMGGRLMGFPGGNATLLRHFVKAVLPESIQGPRTFEAIANNSVNFGALDRRGSKYRMRLSATAIRIGHEGDANAAGRVYIVYEKAGQLYRVRAGGAVLAIGSWVAKHIVTDLPVAYRGALDQFLYGPILIINVALRNWRFLDRLGFSAARWFDGFGYYCTVRQPMVVGDRSAPFDPDHPIIMTFYVPIQHPELPLAAQGPAGRAQLYGTSYAEYERRLLEQMQRLFGAGGFDARRDIAGIVLNRWGHARLSPPPGFFFGTEGRPSPLTVLREPFSRIAFGNSEIAGTQAWINGVTEGKRAITQVLQAL